MKIFLLPFLLLVPGNLPSTKFALPTHSRHRALLTWGQANRVQFDASKESMHVLSRVVGTNTEFLLLGIDFDTKLLMHTAVHSVAVSASWKLKSLLRCKRFYTTRDIIRMFKANILSYLEYRTPALMHASPSVLLPIDRILVKFLGDIGVSVLDALLHFNLGPLRTRRDIAALGVIHRAVLHKGPAHFQAFFCLDPAPPRQSKRFPCHDRQVADPYWSLSRDYIRRSTLGYIWVYNFLPGIVVKATSVKSFQRELNSTLKYVAATGYDDWETLYSPLQDRNRCILREL